MGTLSYAVGSRTIDRIYRATNGGTTFSADVKAGAFDLFDDAPTVDDAIYFGFNTTQIPTSKLNFDITTQMAGTDIVLVWEVRGRNADDTANEWRPLVSFEDDTQGFTVAGANSFKWGLPWRCSAITVNGDSRFWVRCRLVSFSTVTEGGATNPVTANTATVSITGYTDGSPCTLEEIYQYLKTNAPWLGVTKTGSPYTTTADERPHYDFREVCFYVSSRLLVQDCGFEQGNLGARYYVGANTYTYLQLGEKVGDNLGYKSGWLIHHSLNNTYPFTLGSETKIYGSYLKGNGSGYPAANGEFIGSLMDQCPNFNTTANPVMINNNIVSSLYLMNNMPTVFENNRYVFANLLGFWYGASFTCRGLDYAFTPAANHIFRFNNTSAGSLTGGAICSFVNPVTSLPNQDGEPYLVWRGSHAGTYTFAKVWFYDASEDTYTDITTECSDTNLNNVPLHGDVGDMYYFMNEGGSYAGGAWGWWLNIASSQANDYGYQWQWYHDSVDGWVDTVKHFDSSNNFSQDGRFYPVMRRGSLNNQVTINGFTGRCGRLVITEKGTGTPMASRIRFGAEFGLGDWKILEQYTFNIKVQDTEGNVVEGANVLIELDEVEQTNENTDVSGDITTQTFTNRTYFLDPIDSHDKQSLIGVRTENPYNLTVSKTGYETYTCEVTMNKQQDLVIELKKAIDAMPVIGKGIAIRADPTNSTKDRDILIIP